MNLHEYQGKQLLADYGAPIPTGRMIESVEAASDAASAIGGDAWVVKAQVHAGGRGKAGGIRLARGGAELHAAVEQLLGSALATPQTHGRALPVRRLLVEQTLDIARELYLGALVDRGAQRIVFMASAAGGMEIEQVAAQTPEKIFTVHADPAAGLQPWQCRRFAFALELDGQQARTLTAIMQGLYRLFIDKDLSLVEINPLIVTRNGALLALDAKINIDDNALFRHPDLAALRDPSQEEESEREAQRHDLNYIALDGAIGCMVNGAGLAMATMDLIQLHGGAPANFLDVGGGATAERVAAAFKLIVGDPNVRAILVNIFGGIVRCDLIAEGIIQAVQEVGVSVPVVVRLAGTNVERGGALLAESGLDILSVQDLTEAAQQVVQRAKQATQTTGDAQ